MRRANQTLLDRAITWRNDGRQLRSDLRAHGDKELLSVMDRALSELENPAFTGAINTMGVNADAVRK